MAIRLDRIYTRAGDSGKTSRADGVRVDKHDPLISAVGAVDEANATLGVAASLAKDNPHNNFVQEIYDIQNTLFDLGADLSLPPQEGKDDENTKKNKPRKDKLRILPEQISELEEKIDHHNQSLKPLDSFILPGGTQLAATLHLARTLIRRAEREVSILNLHEDYQPNPHAFKYLNRLSDLLFVMARVANQNTDGTGGDVLWQPGAAGTSAGRKKNPR